MRTDDKINSTSSLLGRLWLFPAAYLVHIVEETWGVGVPHGINLSLVQFFVLSGAAWVLLVVGVLLARRLGFSQFLQVCLATVFLLNGFSHIFNSARFAMYDAGVISGTLIFIPLGALTLFALRNAMARRRYFVGIVLGLLMQAAAFVLAM
jgi:hypothetical protein